VSASDTSIRIVVSAYPGFGKTRTIPSLCKKLLNSVDRVLVLTRSIVELDQLLRFFDEQNIPDVGVLIGRERVCPYGAETALECSILRSDGVCQLVRRRGKVGKLRFSTVQELVSACRRAFVCPYDYIQALASQSKIVLTTVSYLALTDLLETLFRTVKTGEETLGLVVDEAHSIAVGVEKVTTISISKIRKLAETGHTLATQILALDDGEELVLKKPHMSEDEIKLGACTDRDTVRAAAALLSIMRSELVLIKRKGDIVEVRTFNIDNILKLVNASKICIFLSASITSKFAKDLPLTRGSKYVEISDIPEEFNNLKIYVISNVRFTKSFRESVRCRKVIEQVLRKFLRISPMVGGCVVLFSSKDFLMRHIDVVERVLEEIGDPLYVMEESEKTWRMIDEFKKRAREERTVLVTYVGNPAMEGLNFLGDELVSMLVLGFPYPEFSNWNELKRTYLRKFTRRTFKCVYLFPAISYTIQAVGRATRDLKFRSKQVFLVDDRFWMFRRYLPSWMKVRRVVSLREFVESFGLVLN